MGHQRGTLFSAWSPFSVHPPILAFFCPSVCALSWFLEVLSKTISPIDFILGLHDLLGGIQKAIAYRRTPLISCWILTSGRLVSRRFLQNHYPHWLHTWYTWPPRWVTECYCILSRSSNFPPNVGLWSIGFWKFSPNYQPHRLHTWNSWPPRCDTECYCISLGWMLASGQLVSGSFLQNYQPHRLYSWYSWPSRWDTDCYCILSHSSDFPPNACLWLILFWPLSL